jgi:hypothetical protein
MKYSIFFSTKEFKDYTLLCYSMQIQDEAAARFLEKAQEKHGDKYDYSKVDYINSKLHVNIICRNHGEFMQLPRIHLQGKGCPKCGRERISAVQSKSESQFLAEASTVHNGIYDYSKVKYINTHSNITIICKVHGEFVQRASHHLEGNGCIKCGYESMIKIRTKPLTQFLEDAQRVHGDFYDYSKVNYVNHYTKIMIACKTHGEFYQTPDGHLQGRGCLRCAMELKSSTYSHTTAQFLEKAKKVHGNLYDYSKVFYIDVKTKIIIICQVHGEFLQTPNSHLTGRGCIKCFHDSVSILFSKTQEQFLESAKKAHGDRYDYSKVKYVGSVEHVIIVCKDHGDFKQVVHAHLSGRGCPKCAKASYSKVSIEWLKRLSNLLKLPIHHAEIGPEHRVVISSQKSYLLDGMYQDALDKFAFEFHGDFWHGNPKRYDPDDVNDVSGKTFGQLYEDTIEKENALRKAGWFVVTIWESDYHDGVLLYPEAMEGLFGTSDRDLIQSMYGEYLK